MLMNCSILLATLSLAAIATAQITVVVPNGTAATEGNSSNAFPWGRGITGSLEHQSLYDSTNFTNQGITYPILISRLRYRANGGATSVGGTYGACTVEMATAAVDALTPSTTFAANLGPNLAQVYAGPVTVAATTAQTPGQWSVDIPLSSNFLYDPTAGDLVIFAHIPPPAQSPITGTPSLQLDVQTTSSLSSRVYNSSTTVYPNATGSSAVNHGVVVELTYVPAAGLFPSFTSTATTGNAPLGVQFTDTSYSSDPAGVIAWLWDVDGDTVTDYTTQHPSHVYNTCGTYDVTLTVIDGSHAPATITRTGLVVIDPIAANFTASAFGGFAPALINFTDTSTGVVTSWSWDLDGDTIVDSTAQHPTWVYATPGTYTVSLTVTNACRTDTETKTGLITALGAGTLPAAPELFQYQLNEVRGTNVANTASTSAAPSSGSVLIATNWASDPTRAGFGGNEPGIGCLGYRASGGGSVNTGWPTAVTGSFSVSFWVRKNAAAAATPFGYAFGNGTFRSFVGGAAGTGITFRGSSLGNVDGRFLVGATPGVWQHLALVVDDTLGQAVWYDNGSPNTIAAINFTPNTFTYTSATNLVVGALTTTGGSPIVAGYDFDDFRFYTRALSAGDVLAVSLTPENASAGASGTACAGPGGNPTISGNGVPSLGNAGFAIELGNAENGCLAAAIFGMAPVMAGTLSLAPWLGTGCDLQTDVASANFHLTVGNAASQPFAVPAVPSIAGLHIYAQWAVLGSAGAVTKLLDCNLQ